jgi:hypothetical protein
MCTILHVKVIHYMNYITHNLDRPVLKRFLKLIFVSVYPFLCC